MIEITERSLAFWYVQGKRMDWLAHIETTDVPDGFKLTYRFRYYTEKMKWDEDEWDNSKDRKSWYSLKGKGIAKGIEATRVVAEMTKAKAQSEGRGEMWELLRGTGTVRDLMKQYAALPFVHMKQVSKEEFEVLTGKCVLEK
jgi:hypothetical protein